MSKNITINVEYLVNHEKDKYKNINSLNFSSFKELYNIFFEKEILKGKKLDSSLLTNEQCKKAIMEVDNRDKIDKFFKIFDEVKTNNCSVISNGNSRTCMSKKVMEKWVNSIASPTEKRELIKYQDNPEYVNILYSFLQDYYHFKDDEGIIYYVNADDAEDVIPASILRVVKNSFKPPGPIGTDWLSNIEIEKVLLQYEIKFNRNKKTGQRFKFCGVYPIDFLNYSDYKINDYLRYKYKNDSDIRCIGLVLNHDKRDEYGSHWVSYVIDKEDKKIFYYDSVGEKPKKEHYKLFDLIHDVFGEEFEIKYNNVKTQTSGGDCGVYALCFIISMMNSENPSETYKKFKKLKLKPSFINSLREYFFFNCKNLPDYD